MLGDLRDRDADAWPVQWSSQARRLRADASETFSHLHPRFGDASAVSNLDTAPVRPFGHGLSYTAFSHADLRVAAAEVPTDGAIVASCG